VYTVPPERTRSSTYLLFCTRHDTSAHRRGINPGSSTNHHPETIALKLAHTWNSPNSSTAVFFFFFWVATEFQNLPAYMSDGKQTNCCQKLPYQEQIHSEGKLEPNEQQA
jgi:hypothetical protein